MREYREERRKCKETTGERREEITGKREKYRQRSS